MRGRSWLPDSWLNRPLKANTLASEKRLCEMVGLVHPDDTGNLPSLHLGSFDTISAPGLVDKITADWLREKRSLIAGQVANGEWDDFTADDLPVRPWPGQFAGASDRAKHTENLLTFGHLFLTYSQYVENVTKGVRPVTTVKSRAHGRVSHGEIQSSVTPMFRPLDMRFLIERGGVHQENPHDWTPDLNGYLAYLRTVAPGMASFLMRTIPVLLPAPAMLRHTYVTGAIGSGKTELLKLMAHGLIGIGNCAVIILDPHGDMAEQIAQWPEFAQNGTHDGRLVYIDPFLDEDYAPCLNPFDLGGRRATSADSQQFIEALEEVLGDGSGANITVPMRNILHHTVPVLMGSKDRSPADLVRFMDSSRNIDLIENARRILPPDEAAFFDGEFQAAQYKQTRLSIVTKLRVMLRAGRPLFVGQSTINLEKLIDDRKVIVFNLARGRLGAEASSALGRFILANLLALAHRRAGTQKGKRAPAHVIVDECHNYLGPSVEQILTDARKFGVCLTLCQQQVGQGMSTDLARSVIGNPELKITGTNEISSYRTVANSTNTPIEDFQRLKDRQFLISRRGKTSFTLDTASHLADDRHAMSEAEWNAVKKALLASYYRPVDSTQPPEEDDAPNLNTPKPKYDL